MARNGRRGRGAQRPAPPAPQQQQPPDTRGMDRRALEDITSGQIMPVMDALAAEVFPRTTEYMAQGLRQAGPLPYARGKTWGLSFDTLRNIGDSALINSAIHARRIDGLRALARRWSGRRHQIGWAVVHKDHNDPRVDTSKIADLDKRIARAEQILLNPHPRFAPHLENIITGLADDRLCIDRPCLNVIWNETRTEPIQMVAVDGATIWPVDIWTDRYVRLNGLATDNWGRDFEAAASRVESEYDGADLANTAYVQIDPMRGISPVAFLSERDIIVAPANVTTRMARWGFGLSPCERSWVAATLYLFGIGYVMDFFKNGLSNKLGLMEGVQIEAATRIVELLRSQHAGAGKHHHTPFLPLPPGAKFNLIDTRTPAQQMEYAETIHHVTMLIAADYSEDGSSINLSQRGPNQSTMSEANRDEERAMKRSEGLIADMHFICDRILTPVIRMIDPDLKVIPAGIDDEKEEKEVELRAKRVDKWISIDEARIEEGRDPFGEEWSRYPAPQAQTLFQGRQQMEQQQHQMEMQQAMGAQQGGGPGGPAGGGQDDGPGGGAAPGEGDAPIAGSQADGGMQGGARGGAGNVPSGMRWRDDDDTDGDGRPERLKSAAFIEILLDDPPADG